jgi:carboxyl-terminal processing protease
MRLPFLYCCRLALLPLAAFFSPAAHAQPAEPAAVPAAPAAGAQETPAPTRDQTDANIAKVTADLVQMWQFSQHPFDAEISSKFLDRYLETLDYSHLFFLQSDLKQFEVYRTNLQVLTLRKRDISPAYAIFSRFLERTRERTAYETNLLRTGQFEFAGEERISTPKYPEISRNSPFEFTGHDRFTPDRHTLANPKDLEEATNLWAEEVRYDYLDEKLKAKTVFSGPVTLEGASNGLISLTRKDTNSSGFDFLPKEFLDQEGRRFGWLEPSGNASNAVVHLQSLAGENPLKITNHFYAGDGTALGSIRFERAPEVAGETNKEVPGRAEAKKYEGVIQLERKDTGKISRDLAKRYRQYLKNYNELTNDGHVLELYLTSLARAYDPHSDYFGRAQAENFAIQMKLSLVGIGAVLHKTESDKCEIEELIPDGPAWKSGQITNHDTIVAVAQKDQEAVEVEGMPLQEVVDMIRGPKDTPVTLTIERANPTDASARQRIVTLVRDKVKLVDKESKAQLFGTPGGIGVIEVPSFYADMDTGAPELASAGESGPAAGAAHEHKSVTTDVAKLIGRLKQEKVGGIILDLRANGGGYLEEAIRLTGLFIGKGPVVQTKAPGPEGVIMVDSSPAASPLYDGPLIVLTSRLSASASEILAGALQDYGRAVIVGDKTTFGKGTVQTVQPLSPFMKEERMPMTSDPGSLHVTIKKFYRASGLTTESNGVPSDIVLPSLLNYANFSESSQPNWLPADEVSSADPPDLNRVKPYLAELSKRSLARREKNKDFAYLQEDIDEYRKTLADKSVSMNEAERLAEQHATEARMEARKKERAARPKVTGKVYELTLKNIALPELQPAAVKPKADAEAEPADADALPEDPTARDLILTETRHIMADYIALMSQPLAAAKGQ